MSLLKMTPEEKTVLLARLKSFAWRAGAWVLVALLNFVSTNIGLFHFPPMVVAGVAYVIGELTKYITTNQPWLKAVEEKKDELGMSPSQPLSVKDTPR